MSVNWHDSRLAACSDFMCPENVRVSVGLRSTRIIRSETQIHSGDFGSKAVRGVTFTQTTHSLKSCHDNK